MTIRFAVACAVSLTVLVLCSPAARGRESVREDAPFGSGEAGKRILEFVAAAESAGFTGAALAAKGGKVVAAVGAGNADLAGKIPITPATLFEIASASKPVTATAVMRLVQDKRLGLDDGISRWIQGVPADCRAITVRHLLQHTSGIPGGNCEGGGDDLAACLPSFLRGGPVHAPGTHWEYWNQGYAILSEIIAKASGKSYTEYLKSAIFLPAGMKSTVFTGDLAPAKAVAVVGRSARGEPRSALDHPYGSYGFQYRGMGGVVTTVWDLWRLDRALAGVKLLGKAAKAEMFKPGLEDYAIGWFVKKNKRGRIVQSHTGRVRGFVCDIRRYPEEDGCLFVLCNHDEAPAEEVGQAIEEILFGDPRTVKTPPGPVKPELALDLAGTYANDRGDRFIVSVDGRVTRGRIEWAGNQYPPSTSIIGMDASGGLVLFSWTDSSGIDVVRDGKGRVTGLSMYGQAFRKVE